MNPRQHGPASFARKREGFALVLVLATLVLLLGLTLAFFSRAELHRQTSSSSTANRQGEILVDSIVDLLVGDLLHEIAAGSEPTDPASPVYLPRMADTSQTWLGSSVRISTAPSMIPQRVTGNGTTPSTLLKQSLSGRPFFQTGTGYSNSSLPAIPARASALNTSNSTQKEGSIAAARWNLPAFASANQTIPSPDWVYLTRSGDTPTTFSTSWGNKTSGNFVIGRFAYNIYDTGGLIDINTVGNLLDPAENARRGRLHQVSLANAPTPLTFGGNFSNFLAWRSTGDTGTSETPGSGSLFDPKRDFSTVPPGSQAFLSRQELIRFTSQNATSIPTATLPHLTTFSRALNAPSHIPEPNRPKLPASPPADDMNPAFASIRFSTETTLARGSDPDLTVPAGTPVMPRRFPLPKIRLLSDNSTDAASLRYYFGLQKQADGTFRYIDDAGLRIKQLTEVAAEGREPNFFEVLQAAILTGSLGRDAGNVYTLNQPYDSNRYYQILQIGANIIDQWDTDDYPTSIQFPLGNPGEYHTVHGIENLPYFNNITFNGYRPQNDPKRFQVWALFDVWNPHRNAILIPSGISNFRIYPRGNITAELRYSAVQRPANLGNSTYTPFTGATANLTTGYFDLETLNSNRTILLNNISYATPTIIGNATVAPDAISAWQDYQNGALIIDRLNVPEAVPEATIATLPSGNRTAFMRDALLYNFGNATNPMIATKWGAKAHNFFRLKSPPLEKDKVNFDLQYRKTVNSPWITYQTVNGFFPQSTDTNDYNFKGILSGSDNPIQDRPFNNKEEVERDTYNIRDNSIAFYGWRVNTDSCFAMSRFDPRSSRFGMNGNSGDPLGTTIRQSTLGYTGSSSTTQFNWRIWQSYFVVGDKSNTFFENMGVEWRSSGGTFSPAAPFGFIRNIPEIPINNNTNPGRYMDRDNIFRPADGYLGVIPTIPGSTAALLDDRPLLLNRPFRSVAELGYVFRDLPYKTLDFFTKNSGDLALLDAFSIDESEANPAVVAGRLNPNSANEETLVAALQGSLTLTGNLSASESLSVAKAILSAREEGPFVNIGDLVSRALTPKSASDPGPLSQIRKTERESAIRTLSALGQTRTWNLMIDLVVQPGRFPPQAQSAADFLPKSERRYWVHFALDRFTGEVVAKQMERVDE